MNRLLHIQVLRGLAALSVAFLHAQHDTQGLAMRTAQTYEFALRFPFMAGVDVFFVISGFVMVYASRRLYGVAGARAVFLARRIARIGPLYWAVTTLYLVIVLIMPAALNSPHPSSWMVFASYLFIPATRADGLVQPLYSLGWTLNYEMFFYVLFGLFLVLPARRAVAGLLVSLTALAVVGSLVELPQPLRFWTDPIVLEFAMGVGLGWLKLQGVSLSRKWCLGLGAVGLGLLATTATDMAQLVTSVRPVAWGIPAALLVAAAALGSSAPETVKGPERLGVALGDMSYAIYLIHPFVIRGLAEVALLSGLATAIGPVGFLALAMASTLAASWVVHVAFERIATAFVRRKLEDALTGKLSVRTP